MIEYSLGGAEPAREDVRNALQLVRSVQNRLAELPGSPAVRDALADVDAIERRLRSAVRKLEARA